MQKQPSPIFSQKKRGKSRAKSGSGRLGKGGRPPFFEKMYSDSCFDPSSLASYSKTMLRNFILDWMGVSDDDLGPAVEAIEFLRFCRVTRRRVFLLSAIPEASFAEESARLGMANFFERAYLGVVDKGERIPSILSENHLAVDETAFFGDTVGAIEAVCAAGARSIATPAGFAACAKLSQPNPDVMVRSLGKLQELLETVPPDDEICVEELELMARIGVSDEERAQPQRLTVSLIVEPRCHFSDLGDDLARTIDYAAICEALRQFVANRQDKLIETLAAAAADQLIQHFEAARVELEVRKFVLPETRHVAVRVVRWSMPAS
jgi:dihydroneopterin aldolase